MNRFAPPVHGGDYTMERVLQLRVEATVANRRWAHLCAGVAVFFFVMGGCAGFALGYLLFVINKAG